MWGSFILIYTIHKTFHKMEIVSVTELNKQRNGVLNSSEGNPEIVHSLQIPSENKVYPHNPFIEANTKDVSLSTLRND